MNIIIRKPVVIILSFFYLALLCHCKQGEIKKENLFTAITHIEDSIIYKIPDAPRLCDEMTVEKQYVNIGDCKLYCEIEGEGIPLVLINGGPGDTHHSFHPWLSGAKDNFKIIYYDQRGCGLSDYNAGEGYSFDQTIEDLEKLRIALKIDKWIVLGHSFGGGVAQYYTIKYPQNVIGMILVGTVPMSNKPELNTKNQNWALNEQEKTKCKEIEKLTIDGKLSYAQYFYNDAINGGWKRQNFLKPITERYSQLATYDRVCDVKLDSDYPLYDFEHAFETCPIPTLICEGKYDSLWSSVKVPMMKKNHPNAKFILFEKSSHYVYSDEPEKFIETISDWACQVKTAGNDEITEWKNKSNELLGEKLQLIENNKAFIKLIKNEGVETAKKYYEDFKKSNPAKMLFFENYMIWMGYQYIKSDKTDEAIELFKLNTREYPQSWNAYDCLGEAYLKSGNKELAIRNYEKSMKLNPDSESGKAALDSLKNE